MTELIEFHGMQIEATCQEDVPYANLRRLCECLGLDYPTQLTKLRDAHWAVIGMIPTTGSDGKRYEMAFVSADTIPTWLLGINAKKVAAEVQPKLRVLQLEMKDVLYRHFMGDRAITVNSMTLADMSADISELKKRDEEYRRELIELRTENNRRWNEIIEKMVPILERIDRHMSERRHSIKASDKRKHYAETRKQGGLCPCCRKVEVIGIDGRIPYAAEFDHFWHRADASFESTWLVCKSCNTKLRNKRRGGFWQGKIHAFLAYHESVAAGNQLVLF